ncbi:hypothetical protein NKDENANG_03024 [Candidatus Entotheonellaceae bacterium PAL068K]
MSTQNQSRGRKHRTLLSGIALLLTVCMIIMAGCAEKQMMMKDERMMGEKKMMEDKDMMQKGEDMKHEKGGMKDRIIRTQTHEDKAMKDKMMMHEDKAMKDKMMKGKTN